MNGTSEHQQKNVDFDRGISRTWTRKIPGRFRSLRVVSDRFGSFWVVGMVLGHLTAVLGRFGSLGGNLGCCFVFQIAFAHSERGLS